MPLERTFRRILRGKAALWQRIPQMKWLRSRKLTLRSHWNLPGVWVMLTSASIKILLKHCSNPGALGLLPMKILLLMMHLLLLQVPPPFQSKCLTFKQLKETCCSLYWSLRLHMVNSWIHWWAIWLICVSSFISWKVRCPPHHFLDPLIEFALPMCHKRGGVCLFASPADGVDDAELFDWLPDNVLFSSYLG